MKKFLWGIIGLVVLILGALVIIPHFLDANKYKSFIVDAAKRATGREVSIDGDITLSLFPDVSLQVSKMSLGNLPGEKKPMASVSKVELEVALLPLLQGGNVNVQKFVLIDPEIYLLVQKTGEKNWQFKAPAPSNAQAGSGDATKSSPALNFMKGVTIQNGTLHYADRQKKKDIALKKINADLALSGPLTVKGSAEWNGVVTKVDVDIDSATRLFEEKGSKLSAEASSDLFSASYKGELSLAKITTSSGRFEARSPDIKGLAAWANNSPRDASAKQSFEVKTNVAVKDKAVNLSALEVSADKIAAKGDLALDISGDVPSVKGNLAAEDINLEPYFSPASKAEAKKGDALQEASSDWGTEPIKLDALRQVNANLTLSAKSFSMPKLHMENINSKLTLKQGVLNVTLDNAGFYEGLLNGTLVVDASGSVPTIKKKLSLNGVNVEKFFKDTFTFKKLSGKLSGNADVSTTGPNQKALVSHLNGAGKFAIEEGKLRGVNLIAMVRNVVTSFKDTGGTQETEFSNASGSVVITNGIINNDDLLMKSPTMTIKGEGKADLPRKYLDYRLLPQFGANAKGLAVPVIVRGPFSRLVFAPDVGNVVKDVLQDPSKAKEQIKSLEDNIKSIGEGFKLKL